MACPPGLVSSRVDGWLVGGLGIVAWLMFSGVPGLPAVPALNGFALWVLLAVVATHFGVSYHLAYGQGRAEVRRHWLPLVAVPAVLGCFAVGVGLATALGVEVVSRGGARLGLVAVYSLTTWHYVKQTYGVTRLAATLRGLPIEPRHATVLRFGLYPLWFFEAATVWTQGYRANDYGFDASYSLLPSGTVAAMRVGSLLALAVIVHALIALSVAWRRVPPAAVWTPYAVAFLWILWQPDHISAILVLGAVHALQYLACAHRAELTWGAERGEPRVIWWCSVFGGALATGMLLTYWLPMWLGFADGGRLGVTMAALVFVVLNLHHYSIDAAVWRSRDGHVRRIVGATRR